ncbi:secreted RxLR effector peptide protein, putative [Phytophthora infestans T30-4]|uniref:RxLR effector protein n=1 Tax=Phytophthora infestans (strain T30-4) TaxID=403677 RepID=D0NQG8_PHYIT|nr:secreted RxLR effector peptide protein, putative [Phytophthora infestans T30-4]EEY62900.1 secreted RxLR effector peptide protein, putative [Phytophthora infestans T30-4]|eukprot:XP_002898775.1 secreted RxLR effector peptide protein, putative [Phytophthora infestans T30-4]
MRLLTVFTLIAASFLTTSDALSTTVVNTINRASTDGPSGRLLRTHHAAIEDDNDLEERPFSSDQVKQLMKAAKDGRFSYTKALNIPGYVNSLTPEQFRHFNHRRNKFIVTKQKSEESVSRLCKQQRSPNKTVCVLGSLRNMECLLENSSYFAASNWREEGQTTCTS